MSDEYWTAYQADQRARRQKRIPTRVQALMGLKASGYTVEALTAYCFRINGVLDVFPVHNRWHDLRTNTRGGAKDLTVWVKETIHPTEGKDGWIGPIYAP